MRHAFSIRCIALGLVALGCQHTARADVPASEHDALVALYESTDGDNWYNNAHWNTGDPICPGTGRPDDNWFGITCDDADAHVIGLDLAPTIFGNNLNGAITALDDLPMLEVVKLEFNLLAGPIPPLANLSNLRIFNVASNKFLDGPLPDISALTHLQIFSTAVNSLTGELPSLDALNDLQIFNVGQNAISGSIPAIAGHANLQEFDVSLNLLTGPLPSLQALPALTMFNASQNALTGTIPALDEVPNLFALDLAQNQLQGRIPDLSDVPALTFLDLSDAHLEGGFPDLSPVPALTTLTLSSDDLTGTIPDLSTHSFLVSVVIDHNGFTGSIPDLRALPNLFAFDASSNALTGPIPPLDGLISLYSFDVSENNLSSELPALSGLTGLQLFYVQDNQLSGPLPDLSGLDQLVAIDISNNALSGAIPAAPPALAPGVSHVCPNKFDNTPGPNDAGWNAATGMTPWYTDCTALTFDLDRTGLGGSWYDPAESGQGIVMQVVPDFYGRGDGLLFGGWFTFDTTAAGGQRWYSLQGTVSSASASATLPIYVSVAGNFDAPPAVGITAVGLATFEASDCDTGSLTYSFTDGSNRNGVIPLTRLGNNVACLPGGDAAPDGSYFLSGAWYDPATSGQGFVFDIDPVARTLFAAWYTYAAQGAQIGGSASERWFSIQSSFTPGSGTISGAPIYASSGGVFDRPGSVSTQPVGTATIAFADCDQATLAYAFTSGENAGLSGSIPLIRATPASGECTL